LTAGTDYYFLGKAGRAINLARMRSSSPGHLRAMVDQMSSSGFDLGGVQTQQTLAEPCAAAGEYYFSSIHRLISETVIVRRLGL
jgi:hypothetical protein